MISPVCLARISQNFANIAFEPLPLCLCITRVELYLTIFSTQTTTTTTFQAIVICANMGRRTKHKPFDDKNSKFIARLVQFRFRHFIVSFFATFHAGSRFSTFLQTLPPHKDKEVWKNRYCFLPKTSSSLNSNSSSSSSSSKHFSWKMVPTHPHRVQQRIFSPSTPRSLVLHTFGGKFRTSGGVKEQ